MYPKAFLSLLFLAAAAGAQAQPIELIPGGPELATEEAPREQLFISPAGEPFRAPPGAPYPLGDWFAKADADRDGRLTAGEFTADHLAFFGRLDVDGDGVVDGFESAAYEDTIVPEVRPAENRGMGRRPRSRGGFLGFGRRPEPPGLGRQGAGRYGLINEPLPVRAADADFDYRVTTEEITAAALRRFQQLDSDTNGQITVGELPPTPAQAMAD